MNLLSRQAERRDTGPSPGSSRAHGRPQSMFLITLKVVPRKSDHGLMAKTGATQHSLDDFGRNASWHCSIPYFVIVDDGRNVSTVS